MKSVFKHQQLQINTQIIMSNFHPLEVPRGTTSIADYFKNRFPNIRKMIYIKKIDLFKQDSSFVSFSISVWHVDTVSCTVYQECPFLFLSAMPSRQMSRRNVKREESSTEQIMW